LAKAYSTKRREGTAMIRKLFRTQEAETAGVEALSIGALAIVRRSS
jgi:hypothetical protein